MSVKIYRIQGEIMKQRFFEPLTFNKLVSATKEEHALERIYAELGSRHRARRYEITVTSISEEQEE
ncbi:50S ribosomal protein L18Ae [Candidatus Bathyarchaeota archaeon]|jgi:large subunit ribosomal protein LX|nr:50S ribosomal protein L18Ae [Candidatus Bathyarchaeota archaeon]